MASLTILLRAGYQTSGRKGYRQARTETRAAAASSVGETNGGSQRNAFKKLGVERGQYITFLRVVVVVLAHRDSYVSVALAGQSRLWPRGVLPQLKRGTDVRAPFVELQRLIQWTQPALGLQLQVPSLNEAMRVCQLKVPLTERYSLVYHMVQSSLGSTLNVE